MCTSSHLSRDLAHAKSPNGAHRRLEARTGLSLPQAHPVVSDTGSPGRRLEKYITPIDADATAATLEGIVARRGTAPAYIRCDNGPELAANPLRDWCRFSSTGSSYIEPGAPWEKPYVESFNGRLRDEFLAVEQFDSLLEAQVLIEDWRIEYNTKRPHSSLSWLAPAAYAERWEAQQHAGLSQAVVS